MVGGTALAAAWVAGHTTPVQPDSWVLGFGAVARFVVQVDEGALDLG